MQRHFDEELKKLKEMLLRMSNLVDQGLLSAIKALTERDRPLAEKVIQSDDMLNKLEVLIEDYALKLLALRSPEARDLRLITAVMKINSDLERIGDLDVNIAERVLDLMKYPPVIISDSVIEMSSKVKEMFRSAMDAFINADTVLAQSICTLDDEVDDLNRQIFMETLLKDDRGPQAKETAFDIILVAKNLERIADHTTNICEDIIFMVEGKTIKHHLSRIETPPNQ